MKKIFLLFSLFASIVSAAQLTPAELHLVPPAKLNCTPVKDQYMSSTCWSFSSLSLLESEWKRSMKRDIDLSEMFVARYSMIRKIERHLKLKGSNFFTPGGQFHDVIWVIKNYGIVPESVYSGKPAGQVNHDHSYLDTLLSHFVTDLVEHGVTVMNTKQRRYVDSLLDDQLGAVPSNFRYAGVIYTPKTFAANFLKINPDDYLEITSYTHHSFYTKFVLEDKYNWTGDTYWNVPLEDFNAITDAALKSGYTVGWDGDADDPDFHFSAGTAYLPFAIKNAQQQRQSAFEDQTTLLDHLMHIVAMQKIPSGDSLARWYYIKNSWGNYSNPIGGFIWMRDDYFQMRTVAIIVNKAAIPAAIRKKMGL